MYDIYIRVSQTGERTDEQATERYRERCYGWAATNDLTIDEVAEDTDVSGSVKVADRQLERLIQKVESGESEGIVTPYLDRLGRDVIEGALAYKRIKDAEGRLICVEDGQDSARAGDELTFNLRLAIAQDYLNRVRSTYQAAVDKKVAERKHITKVPFGYKRGDDGRLAVMNREAKLINVLFQKRAAGADLGTLTSWLGSRGAVNSYTGQPFTKSGIRSILRNRTYLGEVSVQNGKKGQPRVIKDYHEPILTPDVFEAANAVAGAYFERNGKLTKQALLRGLTYCSGCGRRLRITGYEAAGERVATYTCTYPHTAEQGKRATIRASRLDAFVQYAVQQAAANRDPYIAAVIEGSTAYQDALDAVAEAQRLHDELRDDLDAQKQLGTKSWLAALKVRADALELARKQLSRVRPAAKPKQATNLSELEAAELAKFVQRVVVHPTSNGHAQPASERVEVFFTGASEAWTPPAGDPETLAALRA